MNPTINNIDSFESRCFEELSFEEKGEMENDDCGICLEKLYNGRLIVVAHSADQKKYWHYFHKECLKPVLINIAACPHCHKRVNRLPVLTEQEVEIAILEKKLNRDIIYSALIEDTLNKYYQIPTRQMDGDAYLATLRTIELVFADFDVIEKINALREVVKNESPDPSIIRAVSEARNAINVVFAQKEAELEKFRFVLTMLPPALCIGISISALREGMYLAKLALGIVGTISTLTCANNSQLKNLIVNPLYATPINVGIGVVSVVMKGAFAANAVFLGVLIGGGTGIFLLHRQPKTRIEFIAAVAGVVGSATTLAFGP